MGVVSDLRAVPGRLWGQATSVDYRGYLYFVFVKPVINFVKINRLMIAWTLGVGTGWQQFLGSVYLAIQLIVASATFLTPLAVVFVPFALLGLLRIFGPIDRLWISVTGVGDGPYDRLNSLDFIPW